MWRPHQRLSFRRISAARRIIRIKNLEFRIFSFYSYTIMATDGGATSSDCRLSSGHPGNARSAERITSWSMCVSFYAHVETTVFVTVRNPARRAVSIADRFYLPASGNDFMEVLDPVVIFFYIQQDLLRLQFSIYPHCQLFR